MKFVYGYLTGVVATVLFIILVPAGPTFNKRLDGVVSYEFDPASVSGVEPGTKRLYEKKCFYKLIFWAPFDKIYCDVKEGESQYVTWKENKYFNWDITLHIKEGVKPCDN